MVIDFETFISEGLIRTYPIEKMVGYIRKKYNLTNEEIDIERKSIMIDISTINMNVLKDIYQILNMGGYFKSFQTGNVYYFDKKFDDEVFDDLKKSGNVKYLYHISPSENDLKIKSQGLVPKHKNKKYDYPERIYLLSDVNLKNNDHFLFDFCNHLHNIQKCNSYSIYKINFSKLNNIKLYVAPNAKDYVAYYTTDNISPDLIEKIDEVKLHSLNENKVLKLMGFHCRWYDDKIDGGCNQCFLNKRCNDENCSKDGYYGTLDEYELLNYDVYQKIKNGEIKFKKK